MSVLPRLGCRIKPHPIITHLQRDPCILLPCCYPDMPGLCVASNVGQALADDARDMLMEQRRTIGKAGQFGETGNASRGGETVNDVFYSAPRNRRQDELRPADCRWRTVLRQAPDGHRPVLLARETVPARCVLAQDVNRSLLVAR